MGIELAPGCVNTATTQIVNKSAKAATRLMCREIFTKTQPNGLIKYKRSNVISIAGSIVRGWVVPTLMVLRINVVVVVIQPGIIRLRKK